MSAGFGQWKNNFVSGTASRIQIAKKGLEGNQHAPAILWKLLRSFNFNFDVCADIVESINGQSGKKFLSSTHVLVVDRESLLVTPFAAAADETIIEADQKHATLSSWKLNITRKESPAITSSPKEATLDAAQLKFPLRWRKWRAGDAFYPLGADHRKKLSDFLIDLKVAIPDKENVTVLESDGEIIWVVGYRIDHRFRITDKTRHAITFFLTS
jgi:tRNA(Ile)-lysidine synthase